MKYLRILVPVVMGLMATYVSESIATFPAFLFGILAGMNLTVAFLDIE